MAYKKRFRNAYSRGRAWYGRRSTRQKAGIEKWLPFGGGAAAGYLAPSVIPYQDAAITAIAVAPVKVPRAIRHAAQGYVVGRMAKAIIPGLFGMNNSSTDTNGGY
jgi:hypothetical protein